MTDKKEYWRKKIAFYLDDVETSTGRIINFVLLAINLFACGLCVAFSYADGEISRWLQVTNTVVIVLFIIEYLLRIWVAPKRIAYIFSFYGIIDFISIVPFFFSTHKWSFLRSLKVLRILRFIRFLGDDKFFFGRIGPVQLQFIRTLFTVFTILFVSSGLILSCESSDPASKIKTFGDAFYFCVITFSTVGYGDFTPMTASGRWITVIMILGGWILVPWQAHKLIKTINRGELNFATCPQCGLKGHDLDASHCKACGHVIYQEYDGDSMV